VKIKTQTGSFYEIDLLEKKFRRLTGDGTPTPRTGDDVVWKNYLAVTFPRVGDRVFVTWRHTDECSQCTTTSPVSEITDITESDMAVCMSFGRDSQNSC